MPEYLSPGVYVEEIDTGNKPIEGVSTSTVGFLGVSERGPVIPTLVTSFTDYVRGFGGYVENRYLTRGVEGFFQNGGLRCFIQRVVSDTATAASGALGDMTVTAVGPGVWGGNIWVKVSQAGLDDGIDPTRAILFKLTVMYWATAPPVPLVDPTDPTKRADPNRREPTMTESFDNLTPDPRSSNFYETIVNGNSNLITLQHTGPGRPPNTAGTPNALPFLPGGSDGGALTLANFIGDPTVDPGKKSGLAAFDQVDEISILCCPDEHAFFPAIAESLVEQCELLKDRFAIIQAPEGAPPIATHYPPQVAVSKYAAYYYPWLEVTDPISGVPIPVPSGGHVAGIYARTDHERGVHKAPANEDIRGITDLQVQITKGQQDLLNPRGVNALRGFPGRGFLVWGARCTTLDPDWKYINVRRLFIFVEKSIQEGTYWVVFEPNDEPLWARVRRSVGDFLKRLWLDGMLQGKTAEEAYFVRCDRTTMTQADIDNGRLIALIGIAPVKPAEFVIFRIGQWTGGSSVTEG